MKVTRLDELRGFKIPENYGLSYRPYHEDATHYHVWPFNYVVRLCTWIKWEYLNYRESIWYDPDTHIDGFIVKRPY